jgi:hypothetical protein
VSDRYAPSGANLSAFCVLKHPTIRAKISNIALQTEEENVCQLILKWTNILVLPDISVLSVKPSAQYQQY